VPIASLAPEILAPHGDADVAQQGVQLSGCGMRLGDHRERRAEARVFPSRVTAHVLHSPSVFGYVAALAAYAGGDEWLAAQIDYLRGNRDLLEQGIDLPMAHVRGDLPGVDRLLIARRRRSVRAFPRARRGRSRRARSSAIRASCG